MLKNKKAIVIHSGGLDSSLCTAIAVQEFGKDAVLSLSFSYHQRHSNELEQAKKIANHFGVDHTILPIECLHTITENALTNHNIAIQHHENKAPNTLVLGRNGLMARLGAIHAENLGAHCIYMGVIEIEGSNSGYRDCSRAYMDLKQQILRIDLDDPTFEIRTPLVFLSKKEIMELAHKMGILEYLLKETISCYEGVPQKGCQKCPSCLLRNEALQQFIDEHPDFIAPYLV